MPDNPHWNNQWQVIRANSPVIIVLCAHRYEWAARACAAWRDLRADATSIGQPVRTWHDYRRTPHSPYARGGHIR